MGKSLNGKELGKNICQRKDGVYMARFINRFGKRQTIYAKTLNEVRIRLKEEQYKDAKEINIVTKDITLDEWYKYGWRLVSKAAEHPRRKPMQHIIREFRQIWDGEN